LASNPTGVKVEQKGSAVKLNLALKAQMPMKELKRNQARVTSSDAYACIMLLVNEGNQLGAKKQSSSE